MYKRSMFLFILIIFVFLRMFVDYDSHTVKEDEARYLKLSKTFPKYTLFNNSIFLDHPPLFPFLIKVFSVFFPDYLAGILVSFFASIIAFLILYKFFIFLRMSEFQILLSLILFTISIHQIYFSHNIYKEAILLTLIWTTIYFYILGLKGKTKYFALASFFGSLTALTADHVIFLFPTLFISYLIFGNKKIFKIAVLPIILILFVYFAWLGVRVNVYLNNEFYSTGSDGFIENVRSFGAQQIINPQYFKNSASAWKAHFTYDPIDYLRKVYIIGIYFFPLDNVNIFSTKNYFLLLFIYFPIFIVIFYEIVLVIINFLKKKRIKNNQEIFFLSFLVIFSIPMTQKITPVRYLLPILVPLSYFFGKGIFRILNIFTNYKIRHILIIGPLLLFLIIFLITNHYPIFSLKVKIKYEKMCKYVENLDYDGIMVQQGPISYVVYMTNKRVVSIPLSPDQLDFFIKYFNINYIVHGICEQNCWVFDTVEYIKSHPEKYKIIEILEDYDGIFYIYSTR